MARTIKLSISGRSFDTDAPTVQDLLDQIRDYVDILTLVEEAVSDDAGHAIEWRIINASKASPLAFEIAPFSRVHGVHIDERAEVVTRQTTLGLNGLRTTGERPSYFTDKVLAKAESLFERVTNGLGLTEITAGPGLPDLKITPVVARKAAENTKAVLTPAARPYTELGSVEGFFKGVERDGYGRPLLWIKQRLTGEDAKCIVTGDALKQIEEHEIRDVWRNRRVLVFGTIHYKGLGRITQIEATSVRFLRERGELPTIEDILDEDFTGGLRSEDYLERLRNGDLS
jgi:hypothetical protein